MTVTMWRWPALRAGQMTWRPRAARKHTNSPCIDLMTCACSPPCNREVIDSIVNSFLDGSPRSSSSERLKRPNRDRKEAP